MADKKQLKIKDFPDQDLKDIAREFGIIQQITKNEMRQIESNYCIIRLVTILEQFFRHVVERGLGNGWIKPPKTVEIDSYTFENMAELLEAGSRKYDKNYVMSFSYSFQNTNAINEIMRELEMPNELRNKVSGLEGLFRQRHEIVHTVEQIYVDPADIMAYCNDAEFLMVMVLTKLKGKLRVVGRLLGQNGRWAGMAKEKPTKQKRNSR